MNIQKSFVVMSVLVLNGCGSESVDDAGLEPVNSKSQGLNTYLYRSAVEYPTNINSPIRHYVNPSDGGPSGRSAWVQWRQGYYADYYTNTCANIGGYTGFTPANLSNSQRSVNNNQCAYAWNSVQIYNGMFGTMLNGYSVCDAPNCTNGYSSYPIPNTEADVCSAYSYIFSTYPKALNTTSTGVSINLGASVAVPNRYTGGGWQMAYLAFTFQDVSTGKYLFVNNTIYDTRGQLSPTCGTDGQNGIAFVHGWWGAGGIWGSNGVYYAASDLMGQSGNSFRSSTWSTQLGFETSIGRQKLANMATLANNCSGFPSAGLSTNYDHYYIRAVAIQFELEMSPWANGWMGANTSNLYVYRYTF